MCVCVCACVARIGGVWGGSGGWWGLSDDITPEETTSLSMLKIREGQLRLLPQRDNRCIVLLKNVCKCVHVRFPQMCVCV